MYCSYCTLSGATVFVSLTITKLWCEIKLVYGTAFFFFPICMKQSQVFVAKKLY